MWLHLKQIHAQVMMLNYPEGFTCTTSDKLIGHNHITVMWDSTLTRQNEANIIYVLKFIGSGSHYAFLFAIWRKCKEWIVYLFFAFDATCHRHNVAIWRKCRCRRKRIVWMRLYAVADLRKQVLDAPSPFAHFSSFSCNFQENLAEY